MKTTSDKRDPTLRDLKGFNSKCRVCIGKGAFERNVPTVKGHVVSKRLLCGLCAEKWERKRDRG